MNKKEQLCAREGRSILVVEDEALIAIDIEIMLEDNGYRVFGPAGSIESALRLLEDVRPDVAMLDLNIRGRSVAPVAQRLQDLRIPFVIASAYNSFDDYGGDILSGIENIGKPISEHRLIETLDRTVGSA